jgi:D-amino-acid dehydrogenase
VIGSGAVVLCVGLYCVERGFGVTVVERNAEERDGCSFGNAGMIVPSHFIPLAAQVITGEKPGVDLSLVSPDRYN